MEIKQYTAVELLQQLLKGNCSSTLIVSRAAIQAIIKQIQKEQGLTQTVEEWTSNTKQQQPNEDSSNGT